MHYPVNVHKMDGTYVATISHPNGRFQGACEANTKQEVTIAIQHLINAMMREAIESGEVIPAPSECDKGNSKAMIHPMLALKASLHNELLKSKRRKADIARVMKVDRKQVDRILDPKHNSTLSQLEEMAVALGKHIDVRVA